MYINEFDKQTPKRARARGVMKYLAGISSKLGKFLAVRGNAGEIDGGAINGGGINGRQGA